MLCCHGSLLQFYTILGTQLIFVAAIPAIPLSFLALAIHGFWLLLASIVSWLLTIAFSLGVWLVLFFLTFFFLNSTPMINCWLTLCVIHSAFARKSIDLFIQSWPLLLGRARTLGSSLLQPGLWVLEPFWEEVVVGTDSVRIIKTTNTECL